jgi:sporulation protein YlmC with PRC-barrel domain
MQRKHVSVFATLLASLVLVSGAIAADRDQHAANLQTAQLVRADQLIGTAVLDPQGDKIGKVDDLLLDPRGSSVTHAVVARGGFLGMGVKRHAVPWQDLQLGNLTSASANPAAGEGQTPTVAVSETKSQFAQSSPALDRESWREYEPEDVGGASRRVTDILGSEVRDSDQDGIGEVADLVIDADRGQIAYALVDYDGAWDVDADVLSVPWSAVNRSGSLINTELDEESARDYGYHDDLDALARDEVAAAGHSDFANGSYEAEQRPGSAKDDTTGRGAPGSGRAPSGSGRPADARTGAMGEQITISGTIESVMAGTKAPGDMTHPDGTKNPDGTNRTPDATNRSGTPGGAAMAADVLMFRLKADSGTTVTVDAGSQAALTRQNLMLQKGDKITVTGHKMAAGAGADRSGSAAMSGDVIMAQTIQKGSQTVQIERPALDQTQPTSPDKDKQQQKPYR